MKYANTKTKKPTLSVLIFLAIYIGWIVFMVGYFFLGDELGKKDVISKILYCLCIVLDVGLLVLIGFSLRTYELSDAGITEQVWFKNHLTEWNEYKSWGVYHYYNSRHKYICAYKTKEIPVLKQFDEVYIPKTCPRTLIQYTEERYKEFKEYAEKNHIPELREEE